MEDSRYRLAVDVGGTFTDFVLASLPSGRLTTGKWLTTPDDPNRAIVDGVGRLTQLCDVNPGAVELFIHATTLVTNTIIQRRGARTALITTCGFADILEMGAETRYDIYDLGIDLPSPLVPRSLRYEVSERVAASGEIVQSLDLSDIRRIAQDLARAEVDSIAVCLINSYINRTHEEAIGEFLAKELPNVSISLSCQVQPEIREFERASTTAANAYVRPRVERYLDHLRKAIQGLGVKPRVCVMLSSGGTTSPEVAGAFPVRVLESGPAAGAQAAATLGASLGLSNLVSFDMGGTTAKIGLISDGRPMLANQFETAHLHRFKKGSGLTIKSPTVDLIEIGAGGGSIAEVADGLLKVGPHSAGADPGPACYGRGGTMCTVTDADLVLGYLDPENFANREIALSIEASRQSIEALATKLGLSVLQTAWGIHEITNENMARAARVHLIEKGRDPSQYAMIAFGGAGPTHAQAVARKLGMRRVIIPENAGVMSAVGLLTAPLRIDLVRTLIASLDQTVWSDVEAVLAEMTKEAQQHLSSVEVTEVVIHRFADMRYRGQGSEITVPLPSEPLNERTSEEIRRRFYECYDKLYGRHIEGIPIEFVNWRLAISEKSKVVKPKSQGTTSTVPPTPVSRRDAFIVEQNGYVTTEVYDYGTLNAGALVKGPAIVQAKEFAAIVAPNQRCKVDSSRNLVLEIVQTGSGIRR